MCDCHPVKVTVLGREREGVGEDAGCGRLLNEAKWGVTTVERKCYSNTEHGGNCGGRRGKERKMVWATQILIELCKSEAGSTELGQEVSKGLNTSNTTGLRSLCFVQNCLEEHEERGKGNRDL